MQNYLHHKSITIGDCLRALYYQIYVGLHLANKYRYDQFISKHDEQYEFEKLKLALNVQSRSLRTHAKWMLLYNTNLAKWFRE
jgi:hypothetical protein